MRFGTKFFLHCFLVTNRTILYFRVSFWYQFSGIDCWRRFLVRVIGIKHVIIESRVFALCRPLINSQVWNYQGRIQSCPVGGPTSFPFPSLPFPPPSGAVLGEKTFGGPAPPLNFPPLPFSLPLSLPFPPGPLNFPSNPCPGCPPFPSSSFRYPSLPFPFS